MAEKNQKTARLRNITNEVLEVPALGGRFVEPDSVIEIPGEAQDNDDHYLIGDLAWPAATWSLETPARSKSKE